ncbi:MAG: hypothetical protein ACOX1X_03595 [Dethiobacteria bacterium]
MVGLPAAAPTAGTYLVVGTSRGDCPRGCCVLRIHPKAKDRGPSAKFSRKTILGQWRLQD